MEKILQHINFKFNITTVLSIIIMLLIYPCAKFLPESFGFENGLLENIQMVILFLGCYFAFNSKIDKKFFIFVGLVLTILILREVNCGRTLFFAVPGMENTFYSWKEIKYGWLAHPIYGSYMASVGVYFLYNKLYINLFNKVTKTRLPIWDILLMGLGIIIGVYAEEYMHNFVLEEMAEMLFYSALVGIIYLYTKEKV